MLRRLGAVQLDTISVLARSHELVAYARLGPIPRDRIERAYWHPRQPNAFEYWSHAACVLPLDEWPYYSFRRRALRARGRRWHQSIDRVCAEVLARLHAEGPLNATQLGGAKAGGPWWDWSETKIAVEWLLDVGEVICVRRDGWRRVYDLPQRVLPRELLDTDPSDEECLAHLAGVAAQALGAATRADLVDYHRLRDLTDGKIDYAGRVDEAAMAAGLTPVTIEAAGKVIPGWADPAALAQAPLGRHRVTLLSPFDSLLWIASAPGGCSASSTASRRTCRRPSACTGISRCRCSPKAAWPAGSIRCDAARRSSPASSPWKPRPRPRPWPDEAAIAAGLTPVTIEAAGKAIPGWADRLRWPRSRWTAPGHVAVPVRLARLGSQAHPADVRLRAQPRGVRAEGQARAWVFRRCRCWPKACGWPGSRIGSARPDAPSPARSPWKSQPPPRPWPALCARPLNGSAAPQSR